MIVTDLNDRERKRYAGQLEALAKAATEAAVALRAGEDTTALVNLAVAGMSFRAINELADVFTAAVEVSVPDGPPVGGQ